MTFVGLQFISISVFYSCLNITTCLNHKAPLIFLQL